MQLGTDLSGSELSPRGAVTAARTLVETVCKHILDDLGISYEQDADLLKLYRLTASCLHLTNGTDAPIQGGPLQGGPHPEAEKLLLELIDLKSSSLVDIKKEKDLDLSVNIALIDGFPSSVTGTGKPVMLQASKLADFLLKTHWNIKRG